MLSWTSTQFLWKCFFRDMLACVGTTACNYRVENTKLNLRCSEGMKNRIWKTIVETAEFKKMTKEWLTQPMCSVLLSKKKGGYHNSFQKKWDIESLRFCESGMKILDADSKMPTRKKSHKLRISIVIILQKCLFFCKIDELRLLRIFITLLCRFVDLYFLKYSRCVLDLLDVMPKWISSQLLCVSLCGKKQHFFSVPWRCMAK